MCNKNQLMFRFHPVSNVHFLHQQGVNLRSGTGQTQRFEISDRFFSAFAF